MSRNGLIVDIERCHPDAEIPEYQNEGDAGMDLKAVEKIKDEPTKLWFRTGLKIAIPRGYVGLIYPRSSITEKSLELGNGVGVIDSGYRGEIQVRFNKNVIQTYEKVDEDSNTLKGPIPTFSRTNGYEVGDRVAQLIIMPYPDIQFSETESLNFDSERNAGGFGSTDD